MTSTATLPLPTALDLAALPPLGAPLAGGLFVGITTLIDGTHHAVVLLPDKPDGPLPWKKAMAWAEKAGGTLPTRPVSALLFALAREQFEPAWHWTSESLDGSYAWNQYFNSGSQFGYHKSYEGRCRAVRLIQLTA